MKREFIIGVDLGGTNLKIALFDRKYRIIDRSTLNTRRFYEKDVLISALIDSIFRTIVNNRLAREDIIGLGLGFPGPIDHTLGIVHFLPNIPGWREVNLKALLQKRLKLPVFIDNDANLMTLAEHKLGAAKGFNNAICITLGTGVGGGLIINGQLYRGSDNATGEIGHVPINERGPYCNCGGIGCLEAYIGNARIIRQAQKLLHRKVLLEDLTALAYKGNRAAIDIWTNVGSRLGVALTGVVNLLNPDIIVIGGGVAEAGKILFDSIRQTIGLRAMAVQARRVKIVKAKLGANAGLIGAAVMVREEI